MLYPWEPPGMRLRIEAFLDIMTCLSMRRRETEVVAGRIGRTAGRVCDLHPYVAGDGMSRGYRGYLGDRVNCEARGGGSTEDD